MAGVAGAATGMWIEAALLPVGAAVWQAAAAGAVGGFAAGVVEQSILEFGGAYILGTEVSGERILLAGATGGVTGGLWAGASRWLRLRAAAGEAKPVRVDPNAIGRAGEQAAGITGPKIHIDSLIGTAKYRVPDEVIRPAQILREVKNVARLSYTSQLRDYSLFAQTHGYTFELIVRQTTRLSGPLRAAIQRGEIILRYLPW